MARESLTPAIINLQPKGLLGFLGIKNGGQNPQSLGTAIAPTLDLWMQYLWTNSEMYVSDAVLTADFVGAMTLSPTLPVDLPNTVNVVVPQNEYWALLAAEAQWRFTSTPVAAQTFDCQLALAELGANLWSIVGDTYGTRQNPIGAPLGLVGGFSWQGLRYIAPGSTLRRFVTQAVNLTPADPVTVSILFRFARLSF